MEASCFIARPLCANRPRQHPALGYFYFDEKPRSASPRSVRTPTPLLTPTLHGCPSRQKTWVEITPASARTAPRRQNLCRQLMTVPGIGPLMQVRWWRPLPTALPLPKDATLPSWLDLVPKQTSTGDRMILGHISKRYATVTSDRLEPA
jgi:hypothetical protein